MADNTTAGHEPMSDERWAEIRHAVAEYRGTSLIRLRPGSAHAHREALLAEVDRLRADLAAETALAKELLQRNVELGTRLDAAEAKRDDAEAEPETMRGQLRTEWGVRFPDNQIEICDSENDAREWASPDGPSGFGLIVVRRELTKWREAEEGGVWQSAGDGWSVKRPDASLDDLRGPFTGLLGTLDPDHGEAKESGHQ